MPPPSPGTLTPIVSSLSVQLTFPLTLSTDPPWMSSPIARRIKVKETCYFFQGHIGSTNWGINFLVEEAVIPEIVRLAEECGNFAIRGYDVQNYSFLIKEFHHIQ